MRFAGQVAIVTGGSRGIGRAICLRLAEEGAQVAVNYLHGEEEAQAVVASIREREGRAIALRGDVRQAADMQALVKDTVAQFGGLDIMVNNAGVFRSGYIRYLEEDDWDFVVDTCLKGTFLGTKYASQVLLRRGRGGRIINIASTAADAAYATQSAESAAKAAVIAFSRSAAKEFARFGVTVNAVSPGGTKTDMTANLSIDPDRVKHVVPLGRMAEPEEIAAAVAFLASAEASYITGQVLVVNGGEFM